MSYVIHTIASETYRDEDRTIDVSDGSSEMTVPWDVTLNWEDNHIKAVNTFLVSNYRPKLGRFINKSWTMHGFAFNIK